jgi:ribonuclease G
LQEGDNRQKVYDRLREKMQHDRAKHNILPLSKFGLMQITRQRVRPQTYIETIETCPTCFGKGTIMPSLLFTDKLENKLHYLSHKMNVKKCTLRVHPYVSAYIKKGGLLSLEAKWRLKYGLGLKVMPVQNLAYLQYQFIDQKGEEIDMKEEHEIK